MQTYTTKWTKVVKMICSACGHEWPCTIWKKVHPEFFAAGAATFGDVCKGCGVYTKHVSVVG